MTNLKKLTLALAVVTTVCAYLPQDAEATGPLRRWWQRVTGRNTTSCCTTPQQTVLSPAVATSHDPSNLQPGQCMRTCQQTCSRTVVNYVPQTAYRTAYKRVPVTQYKPVTSSDPCTGCTVTCMKPCTTYTYQCQRVPYTTYKPVYRQETYKVPVTTITNGCATGTCGTGTCPTGTCGTVANFAPQSGCSTCGTGNAVTSQNFSPMTGTPTPATTTQTYTIDPSSGTSTQGGFSTVPADQRPILDIPNPQLNGSSTRNNFNSAPAGQQSAFSSVANPQSSQRPVQFDPSSRANSFNASAPVPAFEQLRQPAVVNFDGHTAKNPVRRSWDYNPVRFASSELPTERRITAFAGEVRVEDSAPKQVRKSRWVEVE